VRSHIVCDAWAALLSSGDIPRDQEEGLNSPAQRLRAVLAAPGIHVMPCCFDGLSAKLIADAGTRVGFMSGFAASAARLGLPDTGLISFGEMVDTVRNCCAAAPNMPIIADGDTGYGNALNVQRTVTEYARAGAAGVMIEDQVSPKKCGHTRGKQVIGRDEARLKIRAAVEAARKADILVMARTDARATDGFDEALARCQDFVAEGADMIFLEAPENADEMRRFCSTIGKPCMANMVVGGKTPILPVAELEAIGFKLAAYPLVLLSAAVSAMQQAIAALQPDANTPPPPQVSFEELKKVVGFSDYYEREERYLAAE
jgi:2-methylisocitrate lyase-like PEP mutase family enzyme